jgi:hypothetical protein
MKALRIAAVLAAGGLAVAGRVPGSPLWAGLAALAGVAFAAAGCVAILRPSLPARAAALAAGAALLLLPVDPLAALQVPAPAVGAALVASWVAIAPASARAPPRLGGGRPLPAWRSWLVLAAWLAVPVLGVAAWAYAAPERLALLIERDVLGPLLVAALALVAAGVFHALRAGTREEP